jgi:hypothetical protein
MRPCRAMTCDRNKMALFPICNRAIKFQVAPVFAHVNVRSLLTTCRNLEVHRRGGCLPLVKPLVYCLRLSKGLTITGTKLE